MYVCFEDTAVEYKTAVSPRYVLWLCFLQQVDFQIMKVQDQRQTRIEYRYVLLGMLQIKVKKPSLRVY